MNIGKLIVIDGADGCGKATQTELLEQKLNELNYSSVKIDFPRYYDNFFGKLIGECQSSETMGFSKVNPKIASVLYAVDRFESKEQISKWLTEGVNVVCDRYVSANQLHQGGKIKDPEEREKFLKFLDEMEYEVFGIPRPDLIIYLDVPHQVSITLMKEKAAGTKKAYSGNRADMVEQDHEYQLNARESGIKMLQDETWKRVVCSEDGNSLLTREAIHEMILSHCLEILKPQLA